MTQADSVHSTPPINTSEKPVEVSPEELSARLAKEAAKRKRALKRLRKLREKARNEIDRLLDFLDASDIDPDLEPTLGFMNGPAEMDECEVPEDDEPSLGSFDRMIDQEKSYRDVNRNPDVYGWSSGVDNEQDDCDHEPSLGSVGDVHFNQERWAAGDRRDLEVDGAESGIGDADGLHEQVATEDWMQGSMG
jgi:hypothetical protein